MSITLPPLRKRQTDIAPLAATIIDEAAVRTGRPPALLTDAAIDALERHHWPGNVRELRDTLERALVLSQGDAIDVDQLVMADPTAFGDDPHHEERTDRYEMHPSSRRMLRATINRPSNIPSSMPVPAQSGSPPPPLTQSGMMNAVTVPPGGALPSGTPFEETQRLPNDLRAELRSIERQRILDALTKTAGNQSQAAKLLGMSRYTLMSRLETYGIARPRKSRA
jgi:DNA-binding NtrC family response regulator